MQEFTLGMETHSMPIILLFKGGVKRVVQMKSLLLLGKLNGKAMIYLANCRHLQHNPCLEMCQRVAHHALLEHESLKVIHLVVKNVMNINMNRMVNVYKINALTNKYY